MEDVIEILLQKGYDCFISGDNLLLIVDGLTTQTPVNNIIENMKPSIIPTETGSFSYQLVTPSVQAMMLDHNHKFKRDQRDGIEIEKSGLTLEQMLSNFPRKK